MSSRSTIHGDCPVLIEADHDQMKIGNAILQGGGSENRSSIGGRGIPDSAGVGAVQAVACLLDQ